MFDKRKPPRRHGGDDDEHEDKEVEHELWAIVRGLHTEIEALQKIINEVGDLIPTKRLEIQVVKIQKKTENW